MSQDLIAYYQAIERTSQQMVQAARRDDWTEVARLEASSRHQLVGLHERMAGSVLNAIQMKKKRAILLGILHNDAQVRRLADPALADIELLLQRPGASGLH